MLGHVSTSFLGRQITAFGESRHGPTPKAVLRAVAAQQSWKRLLRPQALSKAIIKLQVPLSRHQATRHRPGAMHESSSVSGSNGSHYQATQHFTEPTTTSASSGNGEQYIPGKKYHLSQDRLLHSCSSHIRPPLSLASTATTKLLHHQGQTLVSRCIPMNRSAATSLIYLGLVFLREQILCRRRFSIWARHWPGPGVQQQHRRSIQHCHRGGPSPGEKRHAHVQQSSAAAEGRPGRARQRRGESGAARRPGRIQREAR